MSLGQETDETEQTRDTVSSSIDSLGLFPHELWDPSSKSISNYFVDVRLEGNGPPIILSRYYDQGGRYVITGGYGVSGFSLPLLRIENQKHAKSGVCGVQALSDVTKHSTAERRMPTIFQDGPKRVTFYARNGDGFVNNASTVGLAASLESWFISCVDGDFTVLTDDGTRYTFGKEGWRSGSGSLRAILFVTKITDADGNSISYNYKSSLTGCRNQIHYCNKVTDLVSITGSDNRLVTVTNLKQNESYRVTSNGRPNPVNLLFDYDGPDGTTLRVTREDRLATVYKWQRTTIDSKNRLVDKFSEVTYPEGGSVKYETRTDHPYFLERVVTDPRIGKSSRMTFQSKYDRTANQYTQTVDTPSSRFVYKVGRMPSITRFRDLRSIGAGHAKVMEFNRYLKPGNTYSNANSPDYSVSYFWRKGPSFIDFNELERKYAYGVIPQSWVHYSAALNFRLENTKTSIKRTNGSYNVFTRAVVSYDAYNNPTRIKEISNDNLIRYKEYDYDNFRSPWINSLISRSEVFNKSNNSYDKQTYTYNSKGHRTSHTSNNIQVSYTYDSLGNNNKTINAEGHSYFQRSYLRGIPRRETQEDGYERWSIVNSDGTVKTLSNWGDRYVTTKYEYDTMRRVSRISSPRNSTSDIFISWQDNARHQLSRQGHLEIHKRYDGFGRLLFDGSYDTSTEEWVSTVYRYDSEGRLIFKSYPADVSWTGRIWAQGTSYTYDGLDRIIREDGPNNSLRKNYTYNSSGYSVLVRDAKGRHLTRLRSYGDPTDSNIIYSNDANLVATTFNRDVTGRLISINRNGKLRRYNYDNKYLLSSEVHPETGTTSYRYFSDGMLRDKRHSGTVTTFQYTKSNWLVKENYGNSNGNYVIRTHDYNPEGTLKILQTVTNDGKRGANDNTKVYSYDNENNLKKETLLINGKSFDIQYDYNNLSVLSSKTYPTGRQYQFYPDAFGRPKTIFNDKKIINSIAYWPNGQVRSTNGNLRINTTQWNSFLPRTINSKSKSGSDYRQTYGYDSVGNTTKAEIRSSFAGTKSQTMSYDSGSRLTKSFGYQDNWRYYYDKNDNITSYEHNGRKVSLSTNNSKNRVTKMGNRSITYDARGNVRNNGLVFLNYNLADQVMSDNRGNSYGYDGHGRRVREQKGNQVTYYFYDRQGLLQYRFGSKYQTQSEYHYIGGSLYARRDSQPNVESGSGGSGGSGGSSGGSGNAAGQIIEQNASNIYFLPGDGTKTWINATCASSLKGVPHRSGNWNDDLAHLTSKSRTCDEVSSISTSSGSGDGGNAAGQIIDQNASNIYFLPGDGTRIWINAACASSLKGVPRRSGTWNDDLIDLKSVSKPCGEL